MGTRACAHPGIASALFTPVQARALALLFGQPDRRFRSAELITLAGGGTGAVHRQLARLTAAGLVTVTWAGNLKYYQANEESPVFIELWGLVAKTIGLVQPIRHALRALAPQIEGAFVYGPVARGHDTGSDAVDLMILSRSLDPAALASALRPAERALARPIAGTVMTPRTWLAKLAERHSLPKLIASGPRIPIFGPDAGTD